MPKIKLGMTPTQEAPPIPSIDKPEAPLDMSLAEGDLSDLGIFPDTTPIEDLEKVLTECIPASMAQVEKTSGSLPEATISQIAQIASTQVLILTRLQAIDEMLNHGMTNVLDEMGKRVLDLDEAVRKFIVTPTAAPSTGPAKA